MGPKVRHKAKASGVWPKTAQASCGGLVSMAGSRRSGRPETKRRLIDAGAWAATTSGPCTCGIGQAGGNGLQFGRVERINSKRFAVRASLLLPFTI